VYRVFNCDLEPGAERRFDLKFGLTL